MRRRKYLRSFLWLLICFLKNASHLAFQAFAGDQQDLDVAPTLLGSDGYSEQPEMETGISEQETIPADFTLGESLEKKPDEAMC